MTVGRLLNLFPKILKKSAKRPTFQCVDSTINGVNNRLALIVPHAPRTLAPEHEHSSFRVYDAQRQNDRSPKESSSRSTYADLVPGDKTLRPA